MMACLVTRPDLPPELFDMLRPHCSIVDIWEYETMMPKKELLERIKGKNALVCTLSDQIDGDILNAAADSLQVIGTISVGFDHIDINECRRRNIRVGNTADVLTDAVAELTISLLLATSRRLFEASKQIHKGLWKPGWNHMFMCGSSLKGSTVGIVGMGRIGYEVLLRLLPFKVERFLYTSRSPKLDADSRGAELVTFERLLIDSDFIIICCSLSENTRKIFSEDAFKSMKRNCILINTSRGDVVDQKALYEALKTGEIKAAGLDVMSPEPISPEDPLLELENVVVLPHIGSASYETRIEMAKLTAQNIIAGLRGTRLPSPVFE